GRISQWIKLESLEPMKPAATAIRSASESPRLSAVQTSDEKPRDETEQQIAQIWRDALGIDEVGINDSFAQLGGHSLLAIRIVSELRKAFQIDIPVRALFDAPTIAELSNYVKRLLIAEIEALTDEEARQLFSKG